MILLVLINLLIPGFAGAQQNNPTSCTSNGNYTTNSTYSTNLNTLLLKSLSSNMSDDGYYRSSVGQDPDTANALALCRPDQTLPQCRTCVRSAAREVFEACRGQRQGAVWSEFCMVRYSSDPILRTQTRDMGQILINTANVSTDGDRFRADREGLLRDLRILAANGSSALKAGAGTRNTSDSTIAGLVQCIPELSSQECGRCLTEISQPLTTCCDVAQGVRFLHRDCNLRYELYSFYNETRLRELRVLLPPPSPPGKSESKSNNKPLLLVGKSPNWFGLI